MSNKLRRSIGWTRFRIITAVAVLSCLAITIGCQSINPLPKFGIGEKTPEEAKIRKLMDWHSGRVEVYRDFRTVFTARAVYLSGEIQRSSAEWEARSRLMTPEERTDFEKKFLGEDASLTKVLVGFYTPEEEQNNLSAEAPSWIAYLKRSDGSVMRATCLDVDEENTRIYMRFLKWDLSWSKLYLLCFPSSTELQGQEDGSVSLMISGPQGAGEIELQTMPPDDQP